MAVDTLFLCFRKLRKLASWWALQHDAFFLVEDLERNDGSPLKPYYMSKNLMRILGKKNKKPKTEGK